MIALDNSQVHTSVIFQAFACGLCGFHWARQARPKAAAFANPRAMLRGKMVPPTGLEPVTP